jgi:hypothetical protein
MKSKSRMSHGLTIAVPAEGELYSLPEQEITVTKLADTRGVVFVEYVALVSLVTIMGAAAVLSLGLPLVHLFRYQQMIISLPIP